MYDHHITLAKGHLAQLGDYEDWQAEQALHAWVGDVVQVALTSGDEKLAEGLRLDGQVTEKPAIREAFQERIKVLS